MESGWKWDGWLTAVIIEDTKIRDVNGFFSSEDGVSRWLDVMTCEVWRRFAAAVCTVAIVLSPRAAEA